MADPVPPLTPKTPAEDTPLGRLHNAMLAAVPEAWRPWVEVLSALAAVAGPAALAWFASRPH